MITQRIRAGDWVYYPLEDTKPHLVEVSEHGRLYIQIGHYTVYFNEHGKISDKRNVPEVFIATPASHKKLSEFYRTEFGIPYQQCSIQDTLNLLFDKQKYVLLQVEADPEPYVYAVERAKCPYSADGSTWVNVLHNNLGNMYVPDTGAMYPIHPNGERIVTYKPAW